MRVRVDLYRTEYGHTYLDVDSLDEAKELVRNGLIDDVQIDDFGYPLNNWEADDDYGYEIVDENDIQD